VGVGLPVRLLRSVTGLAVGFAGRRHILNGQVFSTHVGADQPVQRLTATRRCVILNLMVNYSEASLDRTFAALADPTRRALLARLGEQQNISVSELARPFPVSLPAIMKHLDVLSDAGLITRTKIGRTVACRLTAAPMEEAADWLSRYQRFWSEGLDRLAAFLEEDACRASPASQSSAGSTPRRLKSTKRGPIRRR
jgi:DNA-binding transcriptional ArsR family regulator